MNLLRLWTLLLGLRARTRSVSPGTLTVKLPLCVVLLGSVNSSSGVLCLAR